VQADVAVLIVRLAGSFFRSWLALIIVNYQSALLGRPYPLNAIGEVPLKLMSVSDTDKALLKLANTKQISAQLYRKSEVMKHKSLFFKEYPNIHKIGELILEAEDLIGKFSEPIEAIAKCDKAIALAKQGLNYFHRCDISVV